MRMAKSKWFLPLFACALGLSYTWLGAVAGLDSITAIVVLRLRG
jgi:hypothetical protein